MSNMIIAIVIIEWIYYARIVTNLVISTKQEPYVISSQIMGMGSIHILKKHILLASGNNIRRVRKIAARRE